MNTTPDQKAMALAMNLSLATGLLMFAMKAGAYGLTGSSAIFSDAAESVVHVAAVLFAFYSLRLSHRPADEDHLYGHAKIAFFSAGFEGAMVVLAALFILYESGHKWRTGASPQSVGLGTALTAVAAAINAGLGSYLVFLGRRNRSLILEANGKHVLTDCYTSLAVLVGLCLLMLTKWQPIDPLCSMLVAANILFSGAGLVRSAFSGLMDKADPQAHAQLLQILGRETQKRGIAYHALRHRNVGDAHQVEVHLIFEEGISLKDAHRTATEIEREIERSLKPQAHVTTHLETAADHEAVHAVSGSLEKP